MSNQQDPLLNSVLNQTFHVTKKLGEGGMGAVYMAEHQRLPRPFAIKIIHESVAPDSEYYHRFRREADVCSRLRHEHIVEVVDFNFTPAGQPYIAMEYLDGEDLGERLDREGAFSLHDTVVIVQQICAALTEAHAQGVVHRDLKPQNVFLCNRRNTNNYVKLLDFGISKIQGSNSMLTGTHSMMGTPYYMSPEQTGHGDAHVTARSDIYALAVITYQMLTNKYPISGDNIAQIVLSIISTRPPSINTYVPNLPPAVDAVVQCGMEKDPSHRFDSAEAFGNALIHAVGGSVPNAFVGVTGPVPLITPSGLNPQSSVPLSTPGSTVAYGTNPGVRLDSIAPRAAQLQATPTPATLGGPTTLNPAATLSQPTTLSGAASELGADIELPRPSRLPLMIAGGVVALTLAALGIWFALSGSSKKQKKQAQTTTATAPPETPPTVTAPMVVPLTPMIKVPEGRVVIRLLDLPDAATCKVNGEVTRDNPLVLKKSQRAFRLECSAKGYESFATKLKPDRDLGLRVNMKREQPHHARVRKVRKVRKPPRRPVVIQARPRPPPMRRARPRRPVDDDVPIE
ncbi:MAG: protein kinase [bacterium]